MLSLLLAFVITEISYGHILNKKVNISFLANWLSVWKTGFKPVIGFTDLYKNILIYKAKHMQELIFSGISCHHNATLFKTK